MFIEYISNKKRIVVAHKHLIERACGLCSISQSRARELQLKFIHLFGHRIAGPHLRNTWPDTVKFVPRVYSLSMANFLHDGEVWQARGCCLSSVEKALYNCFSSHQDCSCLFKHHGLCWLHWEKGTKLKEYDICLKIECWNLIGCFLLFFEHSWRLLWLCLLLAFIAYNIFTGFKPA